MARQITQSLISSDLLISAYTGSPYILRENSTLNQKFEIQENAELSDGSLPKLNLLILGIKGHSTKTFAGTNTIPKSEKHDKSNACLREPIPIVFRDIENDLTAEQRELFCLRREEEHEGRTKVAYYGMWLPEFTNPNQMKVEKIRNGVLESTPDFNFDSSDLSPSIPDRSVEMQEALEDGDYYKVFTPSNIVLDPFVVGEIINTFKTRFKSDDAFISEYAACSSQPRLVSVAGPEGEAVTIKEAIGAQVGVMVSEFISIEDIDDVVDLSFEVGSAPAAATISNRPLTSNG